MKDYTQIEYLYRDGSNYKRYISRYLCGVLTEEERDEIFSKCLHNDTLYQFIPSQVGLPEERFDDFDPRDDGPWFELISIDTVENEDIIKVAEDEKLLLLPLTARGLLERFRAVEVWDEACSTIYKEDSRSPIFSSRTRELLFQMLELLRREVRKSFEDWLFSELSLTKAEVSEIYSAHPEIMVCYASAAD